MYKIFNRITFGSHTAKDLTLMFNYGQIVEVERSIKETGRFESREYIVTVL